MTYTEFQALATCVSLIRDDAGREEAMRLISVCHKGRDGFEEEDFRSAVDSKVEWARLNALYAAPSHHVSSSCKGVRCGICGDKSSHKVGEEVLWDDPCQNRHNFTAYVCCDCFRMIFGDAVFCQKEAGK